jgi:phosphoesterase RecJ-like protein
MMQNDIEIDKIKPFLFKPSRGVLALHVHPDPDSVASNLFLADMLREMGHVIDIVSTDTLSDSMSFLKGFETIRYIENKEVRWQDYDVFWALDMSSNDRTGFATPLPESLTTIVIDHHITNLGWGVINLIDTDEKYPSTCSMLFEIAKKLKFSISRDQATILMTGIMGDTGFFMYGLSSRVLKGVSELLDMGADYEVIKKEILGSMDVNELEFISKALERAELFKDVLIISIPYDIWKTYGKARHKNEFIVYYLNKIRQSKLGVLMIEEEPQAIRLEFRSRELEFNVAEKAKVLGGGGHKNAAGAMLRNITLTEATEKVKQLF